MAREYVCVWEGGRERVKIKTKSLSSFLFSVFPHAARGTHDNEISDTTHTHARANARARADSRMKKKKKSRNERERGRRGVVGANSSAHTIALLLTTLSAAVGV